MIQVTMLCDKCSVARVFNPEPFRYSGGSALAVAGLATQSAFQCYKEEDWHFLSKRHVLLCPACAVAYKEHIEAADVSRAETLGSFFEKEAP